jgi:hypothetical protein
MKKETEMNDAIRKTKQRRLLVRDTLTALEAEYIVWRDEHGYVLDPDYRNTTTIAEALRNIEDGTPVAVAVMKVMTKDEIIEEQRETLTKQGQELARVKAAYQTKKRRLEQATDTLHAIGDAKLCDEMTDQDTVEQESIEAEHDRLVRCAREFLRLSSSST